MYVCVHGRAYYSFCVVAAAAALLLFFLFRCSGDIVGLSTISLGDMGFCSGFSGPHPLTVCTTVHILYDVCVYTHREWNFGQARKKMKFVVNVKSCDCQKAKVT